MLIQCTKSLLDKIGIKANELAASEEEDIFPKSLMSWHANFVSIDRRKVIVLMNNETRYPVVIYRPVATDFKNIKNLIKEAIEEALYMEGFSSQVINRYMDLSGDIVFSKTANRSLVANLNNTVRDVEFREEFLDESTKVQRFISMSGGRSVQRFSKTEYLYPIESMIAKLHQFAELTGIQSDVLNIKLYQLNIQMDIEGHDIYRRVLVPSTFSFRHLHNVIQTVFDWHNSHLHEFIVEGIDNKSLLILMDDDPETMEFIDMEKFTAAQERFVALEDVFQEGQTIDYMYDFGDGWRHTITLEKVVAGDGLQASYIDGMEKRPPEDVGGAPGFEDYLKTINNPQDPDYEFMNMWVEGQKERERTHEEINRQLEPVIHGYWFSPYF